MKDIRDLLYKKYYSTFKKGERRERFGFWHVKLWYNEKYLPIIKGYRKDVPVLDLGCGQGFMLQYLQAVGFTNLSGVDLSEEQIAIARERGFNVIHADAFTFLKNHKENYEIIFAIDLVEHFRKEELFELLQLVKYALKPGGIFILQTPNGEGLLPGYVIFGDLTHFTILSALSLKNILSVIGFDEIRVKELGPAFFIHFPLFVLWQIVRLFAIFVKFVEIGRVQRYWTESIICSCRRPP